MNARRLLASLVLVGPLLIGPALANDALVDDDDDLFSTSSTPRGTNADVPDASAFLDAGDDIDIAAPIKIEPPKPVEAPKGPSTRLPIDLNGKTVLADNWAPTLVATDADSVLLEVPVLYAVNGTGFDGAAYWLVAEVFQDGQKITESRTQVSKESVSAKGASVQFFRLFTPVKAGTGVVEVRVSKLGANNKSSLLFVRTVNYTLPG